MSADLPASLPSRPRTNQLVLSRGGRRVVGLFVVLGTLTYVVPFVVGVILAIQATDTARRLDRYHTQVSAAFESFVPETQACAGALACLHEADLRLATAVDRFQRQFGSLRFRPTARANASQLRQDTVKIIAVLHTLASASAAEYNRTKPQLEELLDRFDADYSALVQRLPGRSASPRGSTERLALARAGAAKP